MRVAKPFSLLSQVYDAIMDDVDYEDWAEFILETVTIRGWQLGALLDLGCGTGNATFPMVARGLDVTGLDASAEMLTVAREKLPNVRFVQADFTNFALPTRFSLVYSVFDSLNNLLTQEAFSSMARSVFAHLQPGRFFHVRREHDRWFARFVGSGPRRGLGGRGVLPPGSTVSTLRRV